MCDMNPAKIVIDAKEYYDLKHKLCNYAMKEQKYRWHDLRKNPEDLPKEDGDYIVWYKPINPVYKGAKVMFYSVKTGWVAGKNRKGGIIAWRENEPFEKAEE